MGKYGGKKCGAYGGARFCDPRISKNLSTKYGGARFVGKYGGSARWGVRWGRISVSPQIPEKMKSIKKVRWGEVCGEVRWEKLWGVRWGMFF